MCARAGGLKGEFPNQATKKVGIKRVFDNRMLRRLILPLAVEQMLIVLVAMFNVMLIASAGEEAVSGISLVDMIDAVVLNVFAALAAGGAVVTAQYIGHQEKDNACEAASQLMVVTICISVCIMALVLLPRQHLFTLFYGRVDSGVLQNAMAYFQWVAFSYPFLAVYYACAAVFRAMGNSKTPMLLSLGLYLSSITGSVLAVFVFKAGIYGVAFSIFLARVIASVVIFALMQNKRLPVHGDIRQMRRFNFAMIRRILHIGVPNGLENGIFNLGRVLVVGVIASFGTVQMAANAVANNLDSLGCIPGQAMNLAMLTVVGQSVGAGDYRAVESQIRKLMKISYIAGAVWNVLILLSLNTILGLYNLSPETISLSYILVMIHNGCGIFLWPLSFTLPNALRASNDVHYAMVVSIFSMIVFRVVFSFILGKNLGWGAIGVWEAMILDWIFRVILFTGRFLRGKWKLQRVL